MLKYYIMKKFQILVMLLWLSVCLAGAVESKIRLVHGPYLQNLGPDEVTIVWLSDKPSPSPVIVKEMPSTLPSSEVLISFMLPVLTSKLR